jgi:tRNA pseudouridine38-40 synthase
VHALGQVVTCPDAPDDADPQRVMSALNGMLSPHVAVVACGAVPESFHARFSARSRTYVYALLNSAPPDPFLASTTLHHPTPLDVDVMNEACGHLLGPHDFTSFGRVPESRGEEDARPSAERVLYALQCSRSGRIVRVKARANAFIQQMVRSLVGTLLYVGTGRLSPQDMPGILEARDRSAAGPVAPPHGLCLVSVEYDSGFSGVPRPKEQFDPTE